MSSEHDAECLRDLQGRYRGRPLTLLFVGALAPLLALHAAPASLTLVDNGQTRAVIVVPRDGLPPGRALTRAKEVRAHTAAMATAELVEYLQKSTGAMVPVQLEGTPVDAAKFPVRIYLGACAENQRLVAAKPLQPEEFLLRSTTATLHIFGGDTTSGGANCGGTLNAVYTFLGDYLGVRWLFPGPLGEVVPRKATFTVPGLDRREQPPVAKRKIRDVALTREQIFAPVLKQWGITMGEWQRTFSVETNGPWFRRQRLGARIEIEGGHSYAGYYEKYARDHPDFFALQPDGTRRQVPVRERLCVSNPGLWELVARLRIDALKAEPTRQTISIAPNDGGANKFCMCERCRSWDPPNAPKLANHAALIDPVTRKPFPEYPSLSDRYFRYFNEVAHRVRAELPDRSLVTYAYSVYRTPPVTVQQLEPNLIVCYAGLNLDDIEAWSRIAPKLVIRPNDLGPMIELGLPRNSAPFLARAVKYSVEHHAIAFDFDNCHGNWGGHGLDYYVLAQALWKPDLDVRALIADYCRAAYGPGATAMLGYFEQLEKITDAVRADTRIVARGAEAGRLLRYYTPAALDRLEAAVAEARRAVDTTDAACLVRLAMTEDSLKYARLVTSLLESSTGPNYRKTKLHQERLALVMDYLKQKALTPSIASLHSLRYLRMALAKGEREDQ